MLQIRSPLLSAEPAGGVKGHSQSLNTLTVGTDASDSRSHAVFIYSEIISTPLCDVGPVRRRSESLSAGTGCYLGLVLPNNETVH